MISLFDIHKKLGLNLANGLFMRKAKSISNTNIEDLYEGNFSEYKSDFKVEYALKKLQPHSFFLFNNEPVILFFDFQKLQITKEKLSEKIWNFNKSALAFVNFSNELIVYNGFQFNKKTNLLKTLETIKTVTDITKIEKYSYWQIVTAELWNAKDEEFKKKTRVDTKLLENIKATREILIDRKSSNKLSEKHANRIIGRLIFVRYLIDRNVNLDYKGKGKELLTKTDLPKLILQKDNLFDFFDYLLRKFKGNILPLNGERDSTNDFHLQILSNLFAGENIKSKQQSLFNIFDFDFIPIELISNIYETFLGKQQDADKAFYTPPFLVDYILEQTVKPFVENQFSVEKLSCKTVDFTCGSGIFLCETLRTLINRYINLTTPDKSTDVFKNKINKILVDNIFGNDINPEAIEIAKFSLFITLLDYFENPKDIENFEFPDISKNFFNYDIFKTELNSDNVFISTLDNLFGKEKEIEPDFIIGNPPWGKIAKSPYIGYCKNREKKENIELKESFKENSKPIKIEISNKEFAQAFLLRLSDFSAKNTACHIIVTSKLFYNLQADKFRNYFLNNFKINEVLEISSVRHQIFSNAVGPAAIIKYQYAFGNDTQANKIDYVSLKPNPYFAIFKSILIEKHDYKEVIQKELIKNDWLWKVLVYGHILDYRFIERLKSSIYEDLDSIFTKPKQNKKENDLIWGSEGAQVGNKKNEAKHLYRKLLIQTDKNKTGYKESNLQRYYIRFDKNIIWNEKKVERACNPEIFKSPFLAIKSSLTQDYKFTAAISNLDAVFTKSIYAIKSYSGIEILYELLAILSSNFVTYFIIQTGSSTGIEREQIFDEELYPIPILRNNILIQKVNHLIKLRRLIEIHKKSSFVDNKKISEYVKQFQENEAELNKLIFDLYKLSNTERDLISYSQEITIPILQAKNKNYKEIYETPKLFKPYKEIEKPEIEDYINIFKAHFNKLHNGGERGYFNVKIIQSKSVLACEFSVDSEKREDFWEIQTNENILDLLVGLGFQKVNNGLFIQKDIKTLRRNSFSVAKPKQYKYWHKAIARLDLVEFMEAMLQSQNRIPNGEN